MTTAYQLACAACGQIIQTDCPADLSDPFVKELVDQLAKATACTECIDRMGRPGSHTRRTLAQRQEQWAKINRQPGTIPVQLPNPKKFEAAMGWKFGQLGLLLYGPGKGKSKTAWKVAEREFMHGRKIAHIDELFGQDYPLLLERPSELDELLDSDILLIDGTLKDRLADDAEMALVSIVADRTNKGRPIILTTSDTSEGLKTKISPGRSESLLRMIRDYMTPIYFN